MNDIKEKLVEELLKECCGIFRSLLQTEAAPDASKYGRFPEYAVIVYKEYVQRYRGSGTPLRAWRVDRDTLTCLTLPPPEIDVNARSGMYYSMGFFTFSFPDDFSTARLTMTLGPRYGRGYCYTVEITDDKVSLPGRYTEWIS